MGAPASVECRPQFSIFHLQTASASLRDRRIGGRGHCVWIHEVQLGDIGVVVGVGVGGGGNNRCVQHGEVDGRSGTRAALPALDGDGSPLPRHRVCWGPELGSCASRRVD